MMATHCRASMLFAAALVVGGLSLTPRTAEACGGGHAAPRVRLPPEELTKLNLARDHERYGECDKALAILEELFRTSKEAPHHLWALRIAGSCELTRGRAKVARAHFVHAEKGFSGDAEFEARLAEAEVETGAVKAGEKRLSTVWKRGGLPDVRAYVTLARARIKLKDKPGAKAAVEHALLRFPHDPQLEKLKAELG